MKEGWEVKKLGEVCDKASSNVSQNQLSNDEGAYPIFGASGLIKNVSFYHQENPYLSIVKDGSGVGRVTKMDAKTSVIGTLQYLLPKENVDLDYLYYSLISIDFKKYVAGAAIPHIYFKDYKDEPFLWIPLLEQQRIVSVLDETFAAIEQAKANVERNLQNAKELFQSELNSIFSQKGEGWAEKKLGSLTSKIGSGATPSGGQESYKESGISLIRSMNVHDAGFKDKNLAFIDDIQANRLNNVTLEAGDILLNITGASVARCCIVPERILPARVNQHVSIIRIKDNLVYNRFLHYVLTSKYYKDVLLGIGEQGSTRQAITKVQLENFIVSFPNDVDKQQQIVERLDALSLKTKKLESKYQAKLAALEELKKSVLEKAFKGEL